jgi:hypothetical protein
MVIEVLKKAYLASMVPVVVNAVLNEHQLVADIVAFVSQGDFPRSRLGEKQRGKVLAGWVTRKLRTIAQFGIRDMDAPDTQSIAEEPLSVATPSIASRTMLSSPLNNEYVAPPTHMQSQIPQDQIAPPQSYMPLEHQQAYAVPGNLVEAPAELAQLNFEDGEPTPTADNPQRVGDTRQSWLWNVEAPSNFPHTPDEERGGRTDDFGLGYLPPEHQPASVVPARSSHSRSTSADMNPTERAPLHIVNEPAFTPDVIPDPQPLQHDQNLPPAIPPKIPSHLPPPELLALAIPPPVRAPPPPDPSQNPNLALRRTASSGSSGSEPNSPLPMPNAAGLSSGRDGQRKSNDRNSLPSQSQRKSMYLLPDDAR